MPPFRSTRYHLQEWASCGDQLPRDYSELFNLRQSSLSNAVERIFGVTQEEFKVLVTPMEYSYVTKARIPPAVAAFHNFIQLHDPAKMAREYEDEMVNPREAARRLTAYVIESGAAAASLKYAPPQEPTADPRKKTEVKEMEVLELKTAKDMWAAYQEEKARRGVQAMKDQHVKELARMLPLRRRPT